jgi:hypothetical protein
MRQLAQGVLAPRPAAAAAAEMQAGACGGGGGGSGSCGTVVVHAPAPAPSLSPRLPASVPPPCLLVSLDLSGNRLGAQAFNTLAQVLLTPHPSARWRG